MNNMLLLGDNCMSQENIMALNMEICSPSDSFQVNVSFIFGDRKQLIGYEEIKTH